MKQIDTYGVELEKTIANIKNSKPHLVSQNFFKRLKKAADQRKVNSHYHFSDVKPKIILGLVSDDLGEQGLDNGFNLLETSLPYQKSLTDLNKKILVDLKVTQKTLEKEKASMINLSIHPLGKTDMKTYKKTVVPKGVYPYIWYRGWDHAAGIDAKAQNSPTTGVSVDQAADAVSAVIGANAALIALFANSPFEEGKLSKHKEARLKMWDRMMKNAKVEGDRLTASFPEEPFKTLAQYFNWMFGGKTGIHFVLAGNQEGKTDYKLPSEDCNLVGYKGIGDRILLIDDTPTLLKYLSKKQWDATFFKDRRRKIQRTVKVIPHISHMETMQFAQFTGARIRYGLNHQDFPLSKFVSACQKLNQTKVEEIFEKFAKFVYIEGRDPGANFPDQEIINAGEDIAKSVVISPSAIQTGLIKNLTKTIKYIEKYPWKQLGQLREAAIKDGFDGKIGKLTVEEFTRNILNLAEEGLGKDERWMLAYPKWVLETKQSGADRAINFVKNHKKGLHSAIVDLINQRKVVII